MRIAAIVTIAAVAVSLSACTGTTKLDLCKYSSIRRATYTTAIRAADLYAASGQIVPYELAMGRLAAVTALQVLDTNCPVAASK